MVIFAIEAASCKHEFKTKAARTPLTYGCASYRMQGARKSKNVLRGADRPQHRNGEETLEAKDDRRAKSLTFRCSTDIVNQVELFYKQLKT